MSGARSPRRQRSAADTEAFQRSVSDARDRRNLSDVVRRYTTLRKRGARELVGLCPFHSEKSPSFEVNDAKGQYYCHGCGVSGDAFKFLMEKDGMTFRQAFEALTGDAFPVVSDEERTRRKEADARETAERIALARSIWDRAVDPAGTPAEVYARSRGITMALPPSVRFVMTPRWRDTETGEVGRDYPAMICALVDAAGKLVGVQCIFLQDGGRRKYERVRADGSKAKAKLTFGILTGSAFRMGRRSDSIMKCEGPEDGLTLWQETGRTVWASCGTANLSQMRYPPWVRRVCIAGDNGEAGRSAAEQAQKADLALGLIVEKTFPSDGFKDWNDQLRGIAA